MISHLLFSSCLRNVFVSRVNLFTDLGLKHFNSKNSNHLSIDIVSCRFTFIENNGINFGRILHIISPIFLTFRYLHNFVFCFWSNLYRDFLKLNNPEFRFQFWSLLLFTIMIGDHSQLLPSIFILLH